MSRNYTYGDAWQLSKSTKNTDNTCLLEYYNIDGAPFLLVLLVRRAHSPEYREHGVHS